MENYYKISESELVELLADSCRFIALKNGGVDNWLWYGDSITDYLASTNSSSFDDLARTFLTDYQEVSAYA